MNLQVQKLKIWKVYMRKSSMLPCICIWTYLRPKLQSTKYDYNRKPLPWQKDAKYLLDMLRELGCTKGNWLVFDVGAYGKVMKSSSPPGIHWWVWNLVLLTLRKRPNLLWLSMWCGIEGLQHFQGRTVFDDLAPLLARREVGDSSNLWYTLWEFVRWKSQHANWNALTPLRWSVLCSTRSLPRMLVV